MTALCPSKTVPQGYFSPPSLDKILQKIGAEQECSFANMTGEASALGGALGDAKIAASASTGCSDLAVVSNVLAKATEVSKCFIKSASTEGNVNINTINSFEPIITGDFNITDCKISQINNLNIRIAQSITSVDKGVFNSAIDSAMDSQIVQDHKVTQEGVVTTSNSKQVAQSLQKSLTSNLFTNIQKSLKSVTDSINASNHFAPKVDGNFNCIDGEFTQTNVIDLVLSMAISESIDTSVTDSLKELMTSKTDQQDDKQVSTFGSSSMMAVIGAIILLLVGVYFYRKYTKSGSVNS